MEDVLEWSAKIKSCRPLCSMEIFEAEYPDVIRHIPGTSDFSVISFHDMLLFYCKPIDLSRYKEVILMNTERYRRINN